MKRDVSREHAYSFEKSLRLLVIPYNSSTEGEKVQPPIRFSTAVSECNREDFSNYTHRLSINCVYSTPVSTDSQRWIMKMLRNYTWLLAVLVALAVAQAADRSLRKRNVFSIEEDRVSGANTKDFFHAEERGLKKSGSKKSSSDKSAKRSGKKSGSADMSKSKMVGSWDSSIWESMSMSMSM